MISNDIEFKGVAELDDDFNGGKVLRRWPSEVRNAINDFGRMISHESSGIELRFVTTAPRITVYLGVKEFAYAPGYHDPFQVSIFRGDFFQSMTLLEAGKINAIHLFPDTNTENIEDKSLHGEFNYNVWRILFGKFPAVFYGIETYGHTIRLPQPPEKPSSVWAAYGSSITHGAGATAHHLSYIYQAARHLGVDMLNFGQGGSCHIEPCIADYLSSRTDISMYLLELGVNMRRLYTPVEFEKRVRYMVSELRKKNSKAGLLLITPFPNSKSYGHRKNLSSESENQDAYGEILRTIAAEYKNDDQVNLLEGSDILSDFHGLTNDMVHPSDYGHMLMGSNLARLIKEK